ncbi:hypothetical protein KDW_58710 [Dictyobacter vulcani]|uniref:N-acetyltransferase domain-containing protein n=1 Tax=Dictyobacter vulcani TaxID=2607529 RepID=A0A5J4L072_9CHLR|nr:GNAT family N-acetyltransferase [Dictyobacter vulcani]GER91709.1 hypothetical protein KDW_58710 [Dictyobacter vulcani]
MLTRRQIEQAASIQQLSADYLRTLIAPLDGMWEGAIIPQATFWEIQDQEQSVGYFCLDADQCLLRFHLWETYQSRAQEIFRWLIESYQIQQAMASTIEPAYFSLCLDLQRSMQAQAYLFQDHHNVVLTPAISNCIFRPATESDLEHMLSFYQANIDGPVAWLPDFLRTRIQRQELFMLAAEQGTILAAGEYIPSQSQRPYVDLGMVVARAYRGKGLASYTLTQLKQHAYQQGLKPICSCDVSNLASQKAIQKAGFISIHRIMKIHF